MNAFYHVSIISAHTLRAIFPHQFYFLRTLLLGSAWYCRNPLEHINHEKQSQVGKHGTDLAGETHVSAEILGIFARHINFNSHVQDGYEVPPGNVINEKHGRKYVGRVAWEYRWRLRADRWQRCSDENTGDTQHYHG